MKLQVKRLTDSGESTIGALYIDGKFECWTLEDEHRTKKVFGSTRIPKGKYTITLRKEGGHHTRYLKKFGEDFHKGMLHVRNVPNFKYILIHIGNSADDTAGCLLVGDIANNNKINKGRISQSTNAYKRMYEKVRNAIIKGEDVSIEYINLDRQLN